MLHNEQIIQFAYIAARATTFTLIFRTETEVRYSLEHNIDSSSSMTLSALL